MTVRLRILMCLVLSVVLALVATECYVVPVSPVSPVSPIERRYYTLPVVSDQELDDVLLPPATAPLELSQALRTVYVYPQWLRWQNEPLALAQFDCYLKAGGGGLQDRLPEMTQGFSLPWGAAGFSVTWYVDEYQGQWVEAYCLNDYDLLDYSALVGRWYVP